MRANAHDGVPVFGSFTRNFFRISRKNRPYLPRSSWMASSSRKTGHFLSADANVPKRFTQCGGRDTVMRRAPNTWPIERRCCVWAASGFGSTVRVSGYRTVQKHFHTRHIQLGKDETWNDKNAVLNGNCLPLYSQIFCILLKLTVGMPSKEPVLTTHRKSWAMDVFRLGQSKKEGGWLLVVVLSVHHSSLQLTACLRLIARNS